jgi:hypothetical protein
MFGWLNVQNRWNICVTHKPTYAFTDNVNYVSPAVDAIYLVGFEVEEEGDRFFGDKTSQTMNSPCSRLWY